MIRNIFDFLINQYIFIIHYTFWKYCFKEHIKRLKQEKPEMDDFEEEKKTLILKGKYFENFNILRIFPILKCHTILLHAYSFNSEHSKQFLLFWGKKTCILKTPFTPPPPNGPAIKKKKFF